MYAWVERHTHINQVWVLLFNSSSLCSISHEEEKWIFVCFIQASAYSNHFFPIWQFPSRNNYRLFKKIGSTLLCTSEALEKWLEKCKIQLSSYTCSIRGVHEPLSGYVNFSIIIKSGPLVWFWAEEEESLTTQSHWPIFVCSL